MRKLASFLAIFCLVGVSAVLLASCSSSDDEESLIIYSGRNKNLVYPLLQQFSKDTGIYIKVDYGPTSQMTSKLRQEGDRSKADVFFAQDAGALGSLDAANMLAALPEDILNLVQPEFRAPSGNWVGVSGRARTIVYNTEMVQKNDVPSSVFDLTNEKWRGDVAIAPTNASFQAFVSGMQVAVGDETTQAWLKELRDNRVKIYPNNLSIVDAVGAGEVKLGLVNHYYLGQIKAEDPSTPAENFFLAEGDPGALVNVAGAGILATTNQKKAAEAFLRFLLSPTAQAYFVSETFEYSLVAGTETPAGAPPLTEVIGEQIDLEKLGEKLDSTIEMLEETGLIS